MIAFLIKFFRKMFRINQCAYMYFPMNLPEPLDEDLESHLLDLVALKNLQARNTLIEHNLRLVVYIAKRFESPKVMLEDLISIGSMGLIKGIETFKKDKNIKLATYCSRCIENEILMFFRKIQKQKLEISLDDTLNVDADGNELILADVLSTNEPSQLDNVINNERKKMMYLELNKLSKREKEIISLRFGLFGKEEMTQHEVASYLGISQSYISRLEKKIIDKLKENIAIHLDVK